MFGYSILRTSQNQEYNNELFSLLKKFNVPLEGLHTETGDGVYEACIEHSEVLESWPDRAVLFKTAVKQIAHKHGLIASFMAKWNSALPGCSGHVHQNLFDSSGKENLFYDAHEKGGIVNSCSIISQANYIACRFMMPMFAPTVNSYKRYIEGAWASTSVSWGVENRTTALRVIPYPTSSMRVETRVPGAEPTVFVYGSLPCFGIYGIKHQLPLEILSTKGNEYENSSSKRLPGTLQEATQAMKSSGIAKELFGEAFVNHFVMSREWEWEQFSKKSSIGN